MHLVQWYFQCRYLITILRGLAQTEKWEEISSSSGACRTRNRCYEFPPCRSDLSTPLRRRHSPVRGSLVLFIASIEEIGAIGPMAARNFQIN